MTRACPFCAEDVQAGTVECPHCGRIIAEPTNPEPTAVPQPQPSKRARPRWVSVAVAVAVVIVGAAVGIIALVQRPTAPPFNAEALSVPTSSRWWCSTYPTGSSCDASSQAICESLLAIGVFGAVSVGRPGYSSACFAQDVATCFSYEHPQRGRSAHCFASPHDCVAERDRIRNDREEVRGVPSQCREVRVAGDRYSVGDEAVDTGATLPAPTTVPFASLDRGCATNDSLTINACGAIAMALLSRRNNSIDEPRAVRWLERACLGQGNFGGELPFRMCSMLGLLLCGGVGVTRDPARSDRYFAAACRLGHSESCGRHCVPDDVPAQAAGTPEVEQAPTPAAPSAPTVPTVPNAGSSPTASPVASTTTGGRFDIAAFLRRWYSAAYESTRLPSLDGYYTTAPFFRQGGRTGRTTSANDIFQRLSDLRTQGARFSIHWDSPNTRVVEEDEASTSNDGRLYCYERVPDGDGPVHRLDADAEATIPPGQNLSMRGCTALHGRYIVRVRVTGDGPRVCYETWSTDALCASCPHLQECAGRP